MSIKLDPVKDWDDALTIVEAEGYDTKALRAQLENGPEVTDAMAMAFHHSLTDGPIGADECEEIKRGLRAALAASVPLPTGAAEPYGWPKLDKPASVGAFRFGKGVSSRLVVEAAQRRYEQDVTPEREAARIAQMEAKILEIRAILKGHYSEN